MMGRFCASGRNRDGRRTVTDQNPPTMAAVHTACHATTTSRPPSQVPTTHATARETASMNVVNTRPSSRSPTRRCSRHRRRSTTRAIALVVNAPCGRRTRLLRTRGGRSTTRVATIARRRRTRRGVLARVRIGADGFFALLHDRVVVRAAVRCHLLVRLLHGLAAVALQLDHATRLGALDNSSATACRERHNQTK